jgi:predicted metalloendopeptidase
MDGPILSEDFDFWGRIVNEIATQQSRQWTCYQDTVRRFGGSLARPFIARHYSNDTTDEVTTMISRLRTALAGRITNMWLDGPTQAEAQAKLTALGAKVGHPSRWPTLDGLALSGSYADDDLQIDAWAFQVALDRLTQPVDHGLWATTPLVVNAFYSPTDNAITIPAGILQLPFFGAGYSGASNYGAIGAVLGHELTHGFDSSGRLFDGTGRLRDWWTPETAAAFESRVQCVIDQYASSEVVPGVPVDGRLTLPENIADLGGLNLAYDAWTATGEHERPRGGLDERQQFFVAYAQMSCSNARTAYLETLAETDPHAPAHQRVNGTLANLPAAGQAFSCALGTPLAPTAPCAVW